MKNRAEKLLWQLIILFGILAMFPATAWAKTLDEIQDYEIRVNMRQDGTMDLNYYLEWTVLDDSSQGPLEWVKVGIPNKHVDELIAKSSSIKQIRYMYDGGSYVRLDLDKKYYEGETVKLSFSIHQSYMYTIDENAHLCRYSFTPGWFDEIDVKKIKILWDNKNVYNSNALQEDDGYLIWDYSLKKGDKIDVYVTYNLDVFSLNKNHQYEKDNNELDTVFRIFIIAFIIVFLMGIIFVRDDYNSHSGFGGRGYRGSYIHSGGYYRGRSSCVSHCACACACAGGGRAGCSVKNFYNPEKSMKNKENENEQNTDTDRVHGILEE